MSKPVDGTSQKLRTTKLGRIKHIMITMIPSLLLLFFGLLGNVYGTSIGFGETVSGSIDMAGETDSYTFSANAGDKVTVVMATTSGNLWPGIILRNPEGNELCRNGKPASAEIASCTLTGYGTYSIVVYDSFNGTFTGNYNLSLERLNPGSGPSISFGQKVSGGLVAGDLNSYVFSAHIGDEVTATMRVTQGNLWPGVGLYSPDGTELCSDHRPQSAEIVSCILPSDGSYTLLVYDSFDGTFTGNYDLFLGLYPEVISVPSAPVGTKEGTAKNSYTYSTGGSSSNLDHNIQYFFDWGDGTNSGWLAVGATSASHSWGVAGTYLVRVQARCSRHPSVVSTWSETSEVLINKPRPIEIWHQRYSLPTDDWLNAVAYGNDTFVAVGPSGKILTSTEGINWTVRAEGEFTEYWLWDITYAENIFVLVGSEGVVITSPNGIDWTEKTSPAWGLNGITYGNNIFVAVGTLATIITSHDGKGWTKRDSGVSIPHGAFVTFQSVAYGNSTFVAIGNISDLYGHDWGIILTSPDGINWTRRDEESSGYGYLAGIAYGNGFFVATGEYGTIITSPNGIDWTDRTSGSHVVIEDVAYGNGTFVAVGEQGTILTSTDGINWEEINSETTEYLVGVAYGNDTFVAVGGSIFQSDPLPPPTENITTPTTPNGPATGSAGTSYTYFTGSSSSSLHHLVEYQFDWKGDGSALSSWGSSTQSTSWDVIGIYAVRARARCKTDSSVVSLWSDAVTVTISSAPLPDLTGEWISLNQSCKNTKGGAKCKITGKLKVRNVGDRDAPPYALKFYLSGDGTYNEGDTLLKQVSSGKLKKAASRDVTLSYNFPPGGTASGKYLIAVIDADNTVTESDESNNNILYGPIP